MTRADLDSAAEEAIRIEKKQIGYAQYSGSTTFETTVDLDPNEYADYNYEDLLHLYERFEKMIKASQLGILSKDTVTKVNEIKTKEIESRLKEATAEALQKAAETQKQEVVINRTSIDKISPLKTKTDYSNELEIDSESKDNEKEFDFEFDKSEKVSNKIESEVEKDFERKFESEVESEAELENIEKTEKMEKAQKTVGSELPVKTQLDKENTKITPDFETQNEIRKTEKITKINIPDTEIQHVKKEKIELFEEAGTRKIEKLEEQIKSTIGDSTDESTIKKKMLELTKALFREKSTKERERLKMEITVLKNILSSKSGLSLSGGSEIKKGKTVETSFKKDSTNERVLEALLLTQKSEIAQTKDQIIESYKKQFDSLKKRSQTQMAAAENPQAKRRVYDTLETALTDVSSQIPQTVQKYMDFSTKKHVAELESLLPKLSNDQTLAKKASAKIQEIRSQYSGEFDSIKGVISRDIENMLEGLGAEILEKAGLKDREELTKDVIVEINEMDEGTLLYYLHSKEPTYYKEYERKQISKAQALQKARSVMAKEKGLNEEAIKKYFTQ